MTPLDSMARALAMSQSKCDCFDALEPEAQESLRDNVRAVLASAWQPIESAPKDGTPVLVAWRDGRGPSIMWRNASGLYPAFRDGSADSYGTPHQYGEEYFTHWMPLPDSPRP